MVRLIHFIVSGSGILGKKLTKNFWVQRLSVDALVIMFCVHSAGAAIPILLAWQLWEAFIVLDWREQ